MPLSLAETQARLSAAIIDGEMQGIVPLLVGGRDPRQRLAVHERHYETSLAKALTRRFPALEWLVGPGFLWDAARAFVHLHPPSAPCIAEYGDNFPRWLAGQPAARTMPWLRSVGEIEWRLGTAALAIARDPVPLSALRGVDPAGLPDLRLTLQPGLSYVDADWPADELLTLFLNESAPDKYELDPLELRLEISGARGAFRMTRLAPADFLFRRAILAGRSIGEAAGRAQGCADFDAGASLASLFADGLVTSIGRKDLVQP